MCGRYSLTTPEEALVALFDAGPLDDFHPRYNIAPTQSVPVVRIDEQEARAWARLRWGLVPSWSKDPSIGNRMINARAETAAEKPSFRAALRRRRCLVPADGFYEWKKTSGHSQPYRIELAGGGPFAFAGLWERWHGADDRTIESFTILTTDANSDLATIHHRMPVIIAPDHYESWLRHSANDVAFLRPMMAPYDAGHLIARPITRHVNNPRNDDPACLEPAGLL
jgi:putative SOS response-associated peptidase YedK